MRTERAGRKPRPLSFALSEPMRYGGAMSTTTAINVHHEAILAHLETYEANMAFCAEQHRLAVVAGRVTGYGAKHWRDRVRDYEEKIATLESILVYVNEAN